eukprot:766748-Hanusia_phi.AAC.11
MIQLPTAKGAAEAPTPVTCRVKYLPRISLSHDVAKSGAVPVLRRYAKLETLSRRLCKAMTEHARSVMMNVSPPGARAPGSPSPGRPASATEPGGTVCPGPAAAGAVRPLGVTVRPGRSSLNTERANSVLFDNTPWRRDRMELATAMAEAGGEGGGHTRWTGESIRESRYEQAGEERIRWLRNRLDEMRSAALDSQEHISLDRNMPLSTAMTLHDQMVNTQELTHREAALKREIQAHKMFQLRLEQQLTKLRKEKETLRIEVGLLRRRLEDQGHGRALLAEDMKKGLLQQQQQLSLTEELNKELENQRKFMAEGERELLKTKAHVRELLLIQKQERDELARMMTQNKKLQDTNGKLESDIRHLYHQLEAEKVEKASLEAQLHVLKQRDADVGSKESYLASKNLSKQELERVQKVNEELWARLDAANMRAEKTAEALEVEKARQDVEVKSLRENVETLISQRDRAWEQAAETSKRMIAKHQQELAYNLEVEVMQYKCSFPSKDGHDNPAFVLEQRVESLKRALEHYGSFSQDVIAFQVESSGLQARIAQLEAEKEAVSGQLKETRSQLVVSKMMRDERIRDFQSEKQLLQGVVESLQTQIKKMQFDGEEVC